jgi:hypothetical protein
MFQAVNERRAVAGICSTTKAHGLGVGTVHGIKREMTGAPLA